METVDTFTHAGLGVRILWDDDASYANPRDTDGNLGVMSCEHSRYSLGDKDAPDPRGHKKTCETCDGDGYDPEGSDDPEDPSFGDPCDACEGTGEIELSIVEYLKQEHGATVILPLFLYDHSGITISAGGRLDTGDDNFRRGGRFVGDSAGWDTSSVGVIFDTNKTRWNTEMDEVKVEKQLRFEVELYAAYLEGSVYGYEVVDLDGGLEPDDLECEVLDSCWGYLEINVHKDDAYVRVAATEAAEYEAERKSKEAVEAHRWACADVVTV